MGCYQKIKWIFFGTKNAFCVFLGLASWFFSPRKEISMWMTTFDRSNAADSSFAADRRDGYRTGNGRGMGNLVPLSVWETDHRIQVELDLPGLNPEAIDLNFKDGFLWIRGERDFSERDGQLRYNDRGYGPFERVVKLPDGID